MENLKLDFRFGLEAGRLIESVIAGEKPDKLSGLQEKVEEAFQTLTREKGKGHEFLGWLRLPGRLSGEALAPVKEKAEDFRKKSQLLVCIGIGGSYLGTKALVECMTPQLTPFIMGYPRVVFAGHHLCEDYYSELLAVLEHYDYTVCVISKSGTTTEPAIAFRLVREHIEKKYGKEEARNRITVITDKERGALKTLADQEGYTSFVVPDNIGGRYSVLTPVGLFPLALSGIDISELAQGAQDMQELLCTPELDWSRNIAAQYTLFRQYLYKLQGKKVELLANFEPRLLYFGEWWKQLFGESEGKEGKGIFPASANFTTDLHSLGQYIQEGERLFFETVLSMENQNTELAVPFEESDLDKMNFVAGKRVSHVNEKAEEGTCMAHSQQGGVPVLRIRIPRLNEYCLGQLIYFFEFACGLSGYTLGVNPFDQPGVEAYKKNMFKLLGKPGA